MKKIKVCPYCMDTYNGAKMCAKCYAKKPKVHELWVVCQEFKKMVEVMTNEGTK